MTGIITQTLKILNLPYSIASALVFLCNPTLGCYGKLNPYKETDSSAIVEQNHSSLLRFLHYG